MPKGWWSSRAPAAPSCCRGPRAARPVLTLRRPTPADFAAEVALVAGYADLRPERLAEIDVQCGTLIPFFRGLIPTSEPATPSVALLMGLALDLSTAVVQRIKLGFAQPRPHHYCGQIQPMVACPAHGSFPGGHATQAFALAAVLELLAGAGGVVRAESPAWRMVARIAVNRTVAGVHFPSDSAAGAIPFAHRLLTTASGHSRVAAIWLQDAPARDRRDDIAFGQELRGTMIDELRAQSGDIYRRWGLIEPGGRRAASWLRAGSHGAAVAALAAGFDPADLAGLSHPLIAVSLPDFCVADTSGSFSALFIQAAVVFVIARARALAAEISRAAGRKVRPPLVVNLSIGLTAGARDGSSLIAALQDAISATPEAGLGPVHFTLPTGNSRQAQARAILPPGQGIGWLLPPDDRTPRAVEFWGPPIRGAVAPIALHIGLPDRPSVVTGFGAGGGMVDLRDDAGRVMVRLPDADRRADAAGGGGRSLGAAGRVEPAARPGIPVRLRGGGAAGRQPARVSAARTAFAAGECRTWECKAGAL